MSMEELIKLFIFSKKDKPLNANDLLDFTQLCYIQDKLSITQYRNLFQELHHRGAAKPDYLEGA